jgi:hypothetical protein
MLSTSTLALSHHLAAPIAMRKAAFTERILC